jgi:hypothetical protein
MNAVMGCEEFQEYLAERLAGSLSDRLSEKVHSQVRTHMLSCPECCEEMEDFEEMQQVLQTIPVEPCDSNAMRARFELLMGTAEKESLRSIATVSSRLIRPLNVVLVSLAAIVVLLAAVLGVRQAMKWIPARRGAPPLSASATTPPPKPVAAVIRTGALSGQIRASNGESLRKVRVAVVAVSKSGVPFAEIAVETDADGKYRLDNIPAGPYYVLAGSVDAPTYYPGSTNVGGATIVSIQPGTVLEGIDFPHMLSSGIAEISGRVLDGVTNAPSQVPQAVDTDVTLRLDTGGRLPYWPDTSIVFTGTTGAFRVAASCVVGNLFRASVPAGESYTMTVSNVAPGYAVQSIVDTRMTDLMHGGLFTAAASSAAPSRIVVTLTKN